MNIFYPDRWEQTRLATLFTEHSQKNVGLISTRAFQFNMGTIVEKQKYEMTAELKNTYENYTLVRENDIVINGLNLNYDFVSQRVAKVNTEGIITSAYIVLRPRENVNSKYYCYLLKALDSRKIFHSLGKGIRQTLAFSLLKNMSLPTPLAEEQDQIVRYLDWKVSKIDKLIATKKQLIERYEEYGKALVNQVVTQGLRPDVAMKPSGVDWLGEIPAHWKTVKIKYLFGERSEKGHPNEPLLAATQNMGVVPKDVYGQRTVEATKDLHILKLVKPDDFVISLRSFQGGIERAYYQGIISPAYTIMIPKGIGVRYFMYLAKSPSFIKLLQQCVTGIREGQNINYPLLRNKCIPVPPAEEQIAVADFLDAKKKGINAAIDALQKEIPLLEELKQRLISDVVTGQMDVRDANVPEND